MVFELGQVGEEAVEAISLSGEEGAEILLDSLLAVGQLHGLIRKARGEDLLPAQQVQPLQDTEPAEDAVANLPRSHAAQVVQRHVEGKALPSEVVGVAPDPDVLLEQGHAQALEAQVQGAGQAAQPGADDDGVVGTFRFFSPG